MPGKCRMIGKKYQGNLYPFLLPFTPIWLEVVRVAVIWQPFMR